MIYLDFIEICRNKDYSGFSLQEHHIIPVSCGGLDIIENKIKLNLHDHFWAHVYYYETYKKCGTAPQYILAQYNAKSHFTEIEWEFVYKKAIECISKTRLGVKATEEQLKKISESHKGLKLYHNGSEAHYFKKNPGEGWVPGVLKRKSPELRKIISEKRKNTKVSEETRRKISLSNLGRQVSAETKRKISEAQKGKIISLETREKISRIQKGKKQSREIIEKRRSSLIGKKYIERTQDHIDKIRKTQIENSPLYKCLETGIIKKRCEWFQEGYRMISTLKSKGFTFIKL